jgi:hypothetical protein
MTLGTNLRRAGILEQDIIGSGLTHQAADPPTGCNRWCLLSCFCYGKWQSIREEYRMPDMNGGCLCGDVRYSAPGDPVVTSICHCRHCQKQTGSAFVQVVAVPAENFTIQGKLQTFTIAGDSGRNKKNQFCPRCGSVIAIEAEGFPGMVLIMGGTLDDTSRLNPTLALFEASAQPWLGIAHEMKRFPRMPN